LREALTQHEVSTTYERGWSKFLDRLQEPGRSAFEADYRTRAGRI